MLLTVDEAAEFLRTSRRAVYDGVKFVGFALGKSREGPGRNAKSPAWRATSEGGRSTSLGSMDARSR